MLVGLHLGRFGGGWQRKTCYGNTVHRSFSEDLTLMSSMPHTNTLFFNFPVSRSYNDPSLTPKCFVPV